MDFGDIRFLGITMAVILGRSVFLVWSGTRYRKALNRFASNSVIWKITSPSILRGRKRSAILLIAVIFCLGLALARPQWGVDWKEKKQKGLDIVVAIDTSKSMLAPDESPDRLGWAKKCVGDLARSLKGDRIGLIAFAGEAFLECPLTTDLDGFYLMLNNISAGTIGRGGTSLSSVVEEAARALKWSTGDKHILIVVSDGGMTEGNMDNAVELAKKNHIAIFSVGVGSEKGITIPSGSAGSKTGFVTDEKGEAVISRLESGTLRELSEKTGGVYISSHGNGSAVSEIYSKYLKKFTPSEGKEMLSRSLVDRFQLPLAVGALFLFIEIAISGMIFHEKI